MPKRFPLATLQRVRLLREREEKRKFAERRRAAAAIESRIAETDEQKGTVLTRMNTERRGDFNPETDGLYVSGLMHLRDRRIELDLELEGARQLVEEQRSVMMHTMTNRKAVDILHRSFVERARAVEAREEEARLSEAAIISYGRDREKGEVKP